MKKCTLVENFKNMNDYIGEERIRRQNLLVVEGSHEKNKLFWLIFRCFPEMNIDMDDIWVYGTNIYMLYEDIVKEYGSEWAEKEDDIDLPFVISKKQNFQSLCYKADFINIILVFDYERHDAGFSEKKILEMQKCFHDAADMGKLYINYPMIESYQHLKSLPDLHYAERKIPVSLQPGKKYKAQVDRETVIRKIVEFPHRIDDLLDNHFGIHNDEIRKKCCDAVLDISDANGIDYMLQEIFQKAIEHGKQKTCMYQLKDWITKLGYLSRGQTFWRYMRDIFVDIIYHNICKANWMQNNFCQIEKEQYKNCFENLDMVKILEIQNRSSRNTDDGYIWVLSTCIFFVAEYNFALVMEESMMEQ